MKRMLFGVSSLCLSLFTHAGSMGADISRNQFISLSAGPAWTNSGASQTIAFEPDVISAFVPQNLTNSNILGNLELFGGIQRSFFEGIQTQLGLAAYWSDFAKLNGYIQVDADPNFQNFTYQYKISHWHVALKSKWIAENSFNMNPYISGSVGLGSNRSYGYAATPIISQEIAPPPFQANTKYALSYGVGVGFQRTLSQHLSVAVGYQLTSWGSSELSRAVDQTSGTGLRLGNLYTQGIEFNISYSL